MAGEKRDEGLRLFLGYIGRENDPFSCGNKRKFHGGLTGMGNGVFAEGVNTFSRISFFLIRQAQKGCSIHYAIGHEGELPEFKIEARKQAANDTKK